jgi:hypothetical protein
VENSFAESDLIILLSSPSYSDPTFLFQLEEKDIYINMEQGSFDHRGLVDESNTMDNITRNAGSTRDSTYSFDSLQDFRRYLREEDGRVSNINILYQNHGEGLGGLFLIIEWQTYNTLNETYFLPSGKNIHATVFRQHFDRP